MTPEEARILAVLGHELFLASQGTPLAERMLAPRPGDLVLEITDFGRGWDPNRVGTLTRIEGRPPDEKYLVAPLHTPDQQRRWRNCSFIALPTRAAREWLIEAPLPPPTRYRPLSDYLLQHGGERIEMTFDDIEVTMGGVHLPPSARNPRLAHWWDNDSRQEQAQAWMSAGYHVETVDIPGQRVRFRAVRA
ncbi:hypothetical protein DPM19_08880 [Actinomadura craniellae]|uniref:DUF7662 domain-containing protein n=1 Tax=Actinomadura craniellae TaxID=2231787 RepID=A0A365H9P3_9ACTN|nr:hypothetical protein [Actinomadura craniellae]RAY15864.1 hypothetical protein DPM19_08880 [Actinomadura craniellae]